jgi:hypothetical protein
MLSKEYMLYLYNKENSFVPMNVIAKYIYSSAQ